MLMRLPKVPFNAVLCYLYANLRPRVAYALAALISTIYTASLFSVDYLLGKSGFFEIGDAAQHVSGWLFFSIDEWRFPLLWTTRLNHPEGTSIAFTDSIPIAALVLKTGVHLLPERFNYLGIWQWLCFVLQALAATFVLRSCGIRSLFPLIITVVFSITWPALVFRQGHTSLMSHWLILASIGVYFYAKGNNARGALVALSFSVLATISLMVHPYFVPLILAVYLALLFDHYKALEGWIKQLKRLCCTLALLVGVAFLIGYMQYGSTTAQGFGIYSMNLIAPFCGGAIIPCEYDATGGQGEGYNYLGLGLLSLLPLAIFQYRNKIPHIIKAHSWLVTVTAIFIIYSLSTTVYFADHKVLSYTLPSNITGTFRASGRFFWLAGYLILFVVLVSVVNSYGRRSIVLLLPAIMVQWIDTANVRDTFSVRADIPSQNASTTDVQVDREKIFVYPSYKCNERNSDAYLRIQSFAARHGKFINTGYIARSHEDCKLDNRRLHESEPELHTYVLFHDYAYDRDELPHWLDQEVQSGSCTSSEGLLFCSP